MTEPGDRRPREASPTGAAGAAREPVPPPGHARPMARAIGLAILAVLLTAVMWAFLRGILELGVGLVGLAFLGGWAIGTAIRSANGSWLVAVGLAVAAWLLGLVFTWLLALAILPGSSRTFLERIEGTPFTDWLSPQFGALEIIGLMLYVVTAAYVSRRDRVRGRLA